MNKSVYMQFGPLKDKEYNITINNYTLPKVTKTKFLGIWIDRLLTWQPHFDQLCLKLVKNTQLLRISKNHLNMQTKKLIYYAHFYSHVTYGCTIWGNILKKEQLQKLQKLQNKCIRQISKNNSVVESYRLLKIMKIPEVIKLQNLKLGFRVQHSQLLENVTLACTSDVSKNSLTKKHRYPTRCKKEPNHPKPQSKWYMTGFLTKCIVEFQNLPGEIRGIKDYNAFIQSCKIHLLN